MQNDIGMYVYPNRRKGLVKMQKRHFEIVARAMHRAMRCTHNIAQFATLQHAASIMADEFALANPLFKRAKFMEACGLDSPPAYSSEGEQIKS